MFSVTYKLEPAHEATAARDLTRKLAEGSGRQRGGVGDGRTQQVQGWHHADGVPIQERGQRGGGDSSFTLVNLYD